MVNKKDGKDTYRKWLVGVRDVLNEQWAPIPTDCPAHEYDYYAAHIVGLLYKEATDAELLAYLARVESDNIGLCGPFDISRGKRVVSALRKLDINP